MSEVNDQIFTQSPFGKREMQIYALAVIFFMVVLFAFNVTTIKPPLVGVHLYLYLLFTVFLAVEYWIILTRIKNVFHLGSWAAFSLVFLEVFLVFGIIVILNQRASPYLFLLVFDGYLATVFTRRWLAFLLVAVLIATIAGGYIILMGWRVGMDLFGPNLFWCALAMMSAEIFARQWRQREHIEKLHVDLTAAHDQLRDYTRKAEEVAMMRERERLAHEIHDTLGHTLTALDIQCSLLRHLPVKEQVERDGLIEQAGELVHRGLVDLRRAVKALRPNILEKLTLTEALQALAHDFQTKNAIRVAWKSEGEPYPLPESHTLLFYHGGKEAMNNIRRHAPSTSAVSISLFFQASATVLQVVNTLPDQREIEVGQNTTLQGAGVGLKSLAERTKHLLGSFQAAKDCQGNFTVRIELPVV